MAGATFLKRLLSRREFLKYTGSGLVLTTATLNGCGGGSGGNTSTDTQTNTNGTITVPAAGVKGTVVSDAERTAALTSVESRITDLLDSERRFDPATLLAYLQQQSAFYEAGYSMDSHCAWATFTDGRKLIIFNNANPPPAPVTAAARAMAALSPVGIFGDTTFSSDDIFITQDRFRLVNTWHNAAFWNDTPLIDYLHITGNWVDKDTIPRIGRIAEGLGFTMADPDMMPQFNGPDLPYNADVEGLKNVSGDGVFFLTGSAGYMTTSDGPIQGICTITPASKSDLYKDDLDKGLLITAIAIDHIDPGPHSYLAITPGFIVEHNWSFPPESLVFLNTTGGGIGEWVDAFSHAQASSIIGWQSAVDTRTLLGVAQDFFELLFATNQYHSSIFRLPQEPLYRSYGVYETISFLGRMHLINDPDAGGQGNQLAQVPIGASLFVNQLRPSIEYLIVSEIGEEIQLSGQFGKDNFPIAGRVLIGDTTRELNHNTPYNVGPIDELTDNADNPLDDQAEEMKVIDWQSYNIRISLPYQGERQCGMVQVWNGNRFSNIVHLTLWTIPFQVTRTISGGGGILQRTATMEISIRAFVSGYRLWPDQDLDVQMPFIDIQNMAFGHIGWAASGSISKTESNGSTTTISWTGAGNFDQDSDREKFALKGLLKIPDRHFDGNLAMLVGDGLHVITKSGSTIIDEVDVDFELKTPTVDFNYSGGLNIPAVGALPLDFSENWVLNSGNIQFPDHLENILGYDDCVTQITWPDVVPEFPPEPHRGGR